MNPSSVVTFDARGDGRRTLPRRVGQAAPTGCPRTADGVVLLAPYLWKPGPDAIVEHFTAVSDAMDGWLVGYNNPGHTGVEITPALLGTPIAPVRI